jgi:hypothetical protein
MHHLPSVNCDRIVTIIEKYVVSNRLVSRLGIAYYLICPGTRRVRAEHELLSMQILRILERSELIGGGKPRLGCRFGERQVVIAHGISSRELLLPVNSNKTWYA